jgi:hypothetical protein
VKSCARSTIELGMSLLHPKLEPPLFVPAVIRQTDLLEHRVILGAVQEGEGNHERSGEIANVDPPLDGT